MASSSEYNGREAWLCIDIWCYINTLGGILAQHVNAESMVMAGERGYEINTQPMLYWYIDRSRPLANIMAGK